MQQRMMLMNTWNTLEHICLASVVGSLGENNWAAVCNFMKSKFPLIERPTNWFTPETCEAQYKFLSDKYVRMEISCERPANQILQNLKLVAKQEGQLCVEQEKKYLESKDRIEKFCKNETDMDTANGLYEDAIRKSKEREESMRKLQEGLRSRDPSKTESDKLNISKSPAKQDNKTDGNSPLSTSPLLSSLLNNPPAVQYRPTLSTASFIPSKSALSTTRSPLDKAQTTTTSDVNYKTSYITDVGSEFADLIDQSNTPALYSTSPSAARRLDFQESCAEAAHKGSKDIPVTKDTLKTNESNLDNLNIISGNEEYLPETEIPQEVLMRVLENLTENKMLDKVLEELVSDKEVINKSLNTAALPIDESYLLNSSSVDECDLLSGPSESSQEVTATSKNLISNECDSSSKQFDNNDVTVVPSDISHEPSEQVKTTVETEPEKDSVDSETSVSVSFNTMSESIDVKSEPKAASEYLKTSVTEKDQSWPENENEKSMIVQIPDEKPAEMIKNEEIDECITNNESKKSIDNNEACESYSDGIESSTNLSETEIVTKKLVVSEKANNVENSENKEIEEDKKENEETKEESIVSDFSISVEVENRQEIGDTKSSESKLKVENTLQTELNVEHDQEVNVQDEVYKSATSSRAPSPSVEVKETVIDDREDNVTATSSPISEERKDMESAFDKLIQENTNAGGNMNDDDFKPLLQSKNVKKYSRRRRSTISEASENEISKTVLSEGQDDEEVDFKKNKDLNITVTENLKDELESEMELIHPKEEPLEDTTEETETPNKKSKEKDGKGSESKSSKSKSSRKSNSRSSNKNSSSKSRYHDNRKKTLLLVHQQLNGHKYSNTFQKPITNKQVPGYEDVIYCPIDLQTIRRKIDTKQVSVAEFQRDVLLMINNAKMYNHVYTQVHGMACEVQKEALENLRLAVQNLGEGVVLEIKTDNEDRARKRPSLDSIKRDFKPVKRSKPISKDEGVIAKKIKLEDQDGSSNQS